ncbi:MAG: glutathione S-transferase [Amphritea sp.]|nr:glutathione S-transferase [Amphritea sp.]
MTSSNLPILYSFRRCPYAMRARLAIAGSGIAVELREIVLRDKSAAMLDVSPKGTVPVLVLPDCQVIDESLDIIYWALGQSDPDNWLLTDTPEQATQAGQLIETIDQQFKPNLDRYKYFDRFPEHSQAHYRAACEEVLELFESLLETQRYLTGDQCSVADIATFPFIRQFAHVDREWFFAADYPCLQAWVTGFIESPLFTSIMKKYTPWQAGDPKTIFSDSL